MKQFDSSIVGQPYSEVVSAALGLDKPWHTSPGDLWDWAVQQPGARVVLTTSCALRSQPNE